jgi:hypothetical protein
MAKTPGGIELWLEFFDEIKVFDSQKCTAPKYSLPTMDAKKGGRVLLWIVSNYRASRRDAIQTRPDRGNQPHRHIHEYGEEKRSW